MKPQRVGGAQPAPPAEPTPQPVLPDSFDVDVTEDDWKNARDTNFCVMDAAVERTLQAMGFKEPRARTGFTWTTILIGAKAIEYHLGSIGNQARDAYDSERSPVLGKTTLTRIIKEAPTP